MKSYPLSLIPGPPFPVAPLMSLIPCLPSLVPLFLFFHPPFSHSVSHVPHSLIRGFPSPISYPPLLISGSLSSIPSILVSPPLFLRSLVSCSSFPNLFFLVPFPKFLTHVLPFPHVLVLLSLCLLIPFSSCYPFVSLSPSLLAMLTRSHQL